MVELTYHEKTPQIKLRPNRSLTWTEAKWIMTFMIFFVMIIAIAWSFVGAWLVLPFAGIEVGLFAFLLYRVTQWTYLQQIITFKTSEIIVETGISKRKSRETIDLKGLEVYLTESELDWNVPIFELKNQSLSIRVGEFLNSDDIKDLKSHFENLGYPVCRNFWWKKT